MVLLGGKNTKDMSLPGKYKFLEIAGEAFTKCAIDFGVRNKVLGAYVSRDYGWGHRINWCMGRVLCVSIKALCCVKWTPEIPTALSP